MQNVKEINIDRFKSLVENIPGVVYSCALDQHWTMEYISPNIEALSGYCPSDFIANKVRSFASIIHPDDAVMVDRVVAEAVESHRPYAIDYKIIGANQEIHWVFEEGRANYDENGQALWLDGAIFDVSYRKVNELMESGSYQVLKSLANGDDIHAILELLVHYIEQAWPDMICSVLILDEEARHLLNGAAPSLPDYYNQAIDGLEIGEKVGSCGAAAYTKQPCIVSNIETHPNWQPFRELTDKVGLKACWSYPIFSKDHQVLGTFACYYKTHKQPGELELNSILKAQYVAGIALERKKHEKEILQAKDAAEKANAAKSEFLSRMSHEFRTPLNAVLGFSQLSLFEDIDETQRVNAQEIYDAGKHLLTLVDDVLDFSSLEAEKLEIHFEKVVILESIKESLALLKEVAGSRSVSLSFDNKGGHQARANRTRLKQVLINLISNAIKYNIENGSVDIVVKNLSEDRVRISVTDTGHGMSQEQIERLFVPFERLAENRYEVDGIGIGLVISKALVEKMGGTLGLESQPGKGSTFWVELASWSDTLTN